MRSERNVFVCFWVFLPLMLREFLANNIHIILSSLICCEISVVTAEYTHAVFVWDCTERIWLFRLKVVWECQALMIALCSFTAVTLKSMVFYKIIKIMTWKSSPISLTYSGIKRNITTQRIFEIGAKWVFNLPAQDSQTSIPTTIVSMRKHSHFSTFQKSLITPLHKFKQ